MKLIYELAFLLFSAFAPLCFSQLSVSPFPSALQPLAYNLLESFFLIPLSTFDSFFLTQLFSLYFCLYLSFVLSHSRDPFTIFPFHCLLLSSFLLHSFIPNEAWANLSPDLGSLSLSSICSLLTFVVPSLLSFSYRSLFLSFLISTFLSKSLLSVLLSLSYLLHSHSFHFHILWLP